MKLPVLHRKLWRELWQMRGQALAILLVIVAGVGVGESHVDDRLSGLLAAVDPGAPADSASLHFNVQFPEVLVKVIARDEDEARARERLDRLGTEIRARLGEAVYGEGDDGLPVVVGGDAQIGRAHV